MTAGYRDWSGAARTMAVAVDGAVSAARSGDSTAFGAALGDLNRVDREQLTVLLGAITRDLLERAHPDGLDSEDAELVLQSCIRSTAPWYTPLDSDSLIRALTGALGVDDPDESSKIDHSTVVTHGLLLIADQLTTGSEELPTLLGRALGELMREQTVELP